MATDGIVIDSSDLQADESSFTGESELVKKDIDGDPMLFSGLGGGFVGLMII